MQAKGERDEFAEAIAARAAMVPSNQLVILRDELWRVSMKYAGKISMFPVIVVFSLLMVIFWEVLLSIAENDALLPLWIRIYCYAFVTIILTLIWIAHLSYIRRLRRDLPGRIQQSGVIERLALGPRELPDIYKYTIWPLSLFLGPRPVTYTGFVKLIAGNLDWYLLPEPRRHFRLEWLWQIFFTVGVLWSIVNHALGLQSAQQTSTHTTGFPAPLLLCSGLILLNVTALVICHSLHRLVSCTDALYLEVKQRLRV